MAARKSSSRLTISEHRSRLAQLGYRLPGEDTQMGLALEYFLNNPNREVNHKDAKYWIEQEWTRRTGRKCEDPDKPIRTLYQYGILKKISNGVYRFDPEDLAEQAGSHFSENVKAQVFDRDGFKCVICGLGRDDGVVLHVDHKIPRDRGGQGTLSNGQTLCSMHNYRKKNLSQVEMGERFFQQLRLDVLSGDVETAEAKAHLQLIEEVLAAYERFNQLSTSMHTSEQITSEDPQQLMGTQ